MYPVHSQWHQGFDHTFAEGPRSRVEVGCRREEQISTREESARRDTRRGTRWVVVRIALLFFDNEGKSFLAGHKILLTEI